MINFTSLCNSAFANEMAKDAISIHLFANSIDGAPIHWRVNTEEEVKAFSGQWVRLVFIYQDGHTSADDAFVY